MKKILLVVAMVLIAGCNPFCNHDMDKVSECVLESANEQVLKNQNLKTSTLSDTPHWYFKKKYILVLKCKKCGTVKEIVEENP